MVAVVGLAVVGLAVVGLAVVGLAVVGLAVVGLAVVGLAVVGLAVVGLAVVGLAVVVVGVAVLVGCTEDVKDVVTSFSLDSCVVLSEVSTACVIVVAVEKASDVADCATTALSWITEVAMLSTSALATTIGADKVAVALAAEAV